jgi:hypothetical protein
MRFSMVLLVACALTCTAREKKTIPNEAGNDSLDISADALLDKDQIKTALGAELPAGIIAVEVKIMPKGEAPISISRDDFVLLSHKDGQRSGPYSPSQIAGSATMVVRTQTTGGGVGGQNGGPTWGGIPGTMGRPRRMDGPGGGAGNTAGEESATASIEHDKDKKDNPLLKTLDAHMLQDKEISEPVTGLLYFPLEGKVKPKDLELIYKGPAGKLLVNFH